MTGLCRVSFAFCLLLSAVLAGCSATPTRSLQAVDTAVSVGVSASYRGRLALKIDSDEASDFGPPKGQSFSAGFELAGNAQTGSLTLTNPLGSVVANLLWSQGTAELQVNGARQSFQSLDALVKHVTGTVVPVDSLFNWLAGRSAVAAEWEADLSQISIGRLTARRNLPSKVELKMVVEP